MSENNILDKAFQFAIRIVKLQQYLVNTHRELVLSKQLLRSGTSIGANINEAQAAQSHADFIAKMAIASKESRETYYWLRLLCATDYLNSQDEHIKSILVQSEELIKILTSIVKTAQQNQKK
ncbi:four helix bundle protein [Shewanella xiamenensis]|uniref:four helix bundle protein n=1 Tax=Shewanella xiamenensis TaxID=332186 RepID=UPI00313D09A8